MAGGWAILVGIDSYHESLGSLKYAGADCRALRDVLVSGPLGFPSDQVILLDDTQDSGHRPTFANIHSVLGSWLAAPKEDDLVFVYFAGHGRLVDGKTYLVPGDATLASIHTLGIPLRHFQDLVERSKAKRKILVLDACHSGAGRDVSPMSATMQDAIAQGTGIYTIASCGAEELSHEWNEKGHGVFSHFLTEALGGGCAPAADGRLTVDRLYEWVHERVAKWAVQHRCAQTPQRFAKGAGTVVLTEMPADPTALAEQYRRELEQTRGRLLECELRLAQIQTQPSGSDSRTQFVPRLLGKKSWLFFGCLSNEDRLLNELASCLAQSTPRGRIEVPADWGKRDDHIADRAHGLIVRGLSARGFTVVGEGLGEAIVEIYRVGRENVVDAWARVRAIARINRGTVWKGEFHIDDY